MFNILSVFGVKWIWVWVWVWVRVRRGGLGKRVFGVDVGGRVSRAGMSWGKIRGQCEVGVRVRVGWTLGNGDGWMEKMFWGLSSALGVGNKRCLFLFTR